LRVIVIGEPCIDMIHKADGKIFNEPGGISYSIIASAVLNDGIEVVPVIGLHKDDEPYFRQLLQDLSSVNLSGVYSTQLRTRRVDLFYEDENNRWECSTQPIEPTPFEKIQPFLPAEGIHLNLISGSDVDLSTLKKVRTASFNSHIHLDLHNIVMKHLPDTKRVRAAREDYLEWCGLADTVQLNEDEANAIDASMPNRYLLAEKILGTGVKALVITLAERGLVLFEKESGKVAEHFFPPRAIDVVDPTGSGDVFGAAFLHAVMRGKSFMEAAEFGVEIAAKKVGITGPSGMLNWKTVGAHD